jgi:hypothetical protein
MQGEAERSQQFARTLPISTTIHERRLSRFDCPAPSRSTKSHSLNCSMLLLQPLVCPILSAERDHSDGPIPLRLHGKKFRGFGHISQPIRH